MSSLDSELFIEHTTPIRQVMARIDRSPFRIALIVDQDSRLVGYFTDAEIRNHLILGADESLEIQTLIHQEPVYAEESELSDFVKVDAVVKRFLERSSVYTFNRIPIVDAQKKVIDLVTYKDLVATPARLQSMEKPRFSQLVHERKVQKVLVIGGAGYLGSVLTRKLLGAQYRVRILDNFLFGLESLSYLPGNEKLEIVQGDICNISDVVRSMEGIDAVILLAAIVGDPASKSEPTKTIEINYLASRSIAECCRYQQINRLVYASTCSVYGKSENEAGMLTEDSPLNPVSLYARTKIKSEQGILDLVDSNFAPTILRMGTLYGYSPRMRFDLVINTLSMKAVIEKKIEVFGGAQWRPFLHVEDAASAFMACLNAPLTRIQGQAYNVGSDDQNFTILEIAKLIELANPGIEVEIQQANVDERNYRVSFEKIVKHLEFRREHLVQDQVSVLRDKISALQSNPYDDRYYNFVGADIPPKQRAYYSIED